MNKNPLKTVFEPGKHGKEEANARNYSPRLSFGREAGARSAQVVSRSRDACEFAVFSVLEPNDGLIDDWKGRSISGPVLL